jgi:hypothetical protein
MLYQTTPQSTYTVLGPSTLGQVPRVQQDSRTLSNYLKQEVQKTYNPIVVDNKENRNSNMVESGYTLRREFTSSPPRAFKSKIGSSRDSFNREMPVNNFAPLNFHQVRISKDQMPMPEKASEKLLFKFKVYPTRIEKCQIDEFGNEIEGGLLEVTHTTSPYQPQTEKLQIRDLVLPPSFKLISSRYIQLPLPRESQEILALQQQAERQMQADLLKQQEELRTQELLLQQHQAWIREEEIRQQQAEELNRQRAQHYMEEQARIAHQREEEAAWARYREQIEQHNIQQVKYQRQLEEYRNLQYIIRRSHEIFSQALGNQVNNDFGNQGDLVEPVFLETDQSEGQNQILQSIPLQVRPLGNNLPRTAPEEGSAVWTGRVVPVNEQSAFWPIQRQVTQESSKPRHMFESLVPPRDVETTYHPSNPMPPPVMDYVLQGPGMSHSAVMAQPSQNDQKRDTAIISKDFNDWIERGVFKQIHTGQPQGLSLIDEVAEDKSDCSPYKMARDRSCYTLDQKSLILAKAPQEKGSSFSTYAQENMEMHPEPKPYTGESSLSNNHQGDYCGYKQAPMQNYFQSICVEPAGRINPKPVEEVDISPSHTADNLAAPSQKVLSSAYLYQQSRFAFKGPTFTEYAINEVRAEEEEENVRDRRVKEMTPNQSHEFRAHPIDTDNSNSPKKDGRDSCQVVFPSLRFSSARVDRSIQARSSGGDFNNIGSGDFVILQPSKPEEKQMNAYIIAPIHVDGHRKVVQSEATQADFLSPYLATQLMQQILNSRDFSAEPNGQPFTVTVSQDQTAEKNNYFINVELTPEMQNVPESTIPVNAQSYNTQPFDFKKKNQTVDSTDLAMQMNRSLREEEDEVTIDGLFKENSLNSSPRGMGLCLPEDNIIHPVREYKLPLEGIQEQSREESEHRHASRQIVGDSRQSDVFDSRTYDPNTLPQYQSVQKGLSASRQDLLDIIHEEINPNNGTPVHFADFFRPTEENRTSQNYQTQHTPLEIEDYIQRSIKRGTQTPDKQPLTQRSVTGVPIEPVSAQRTEEAVNFTFEIQKKPAQVVQSSQERKNSPMPKKSVPKAEPAPQSRSKSKSVKRNSEPITKKPQTAKPVFAEGEEDPEPIIIKIPEKPSDTSSVKSAKVKPTDKKASPKPSRSPTPLKGEGDYKSVNQIVKQTLDESRSRPGKEEAKPMNHSKGTISPVSPITTKTQKRSVTPTTRNKQKEQPKESLRREPSPIAPTKYKQTIKTLFQDQVGPRKRPIDEETDTIYRQKPHKPEPSLSHYNQASDSDNGLDMSGHHLHVPTNIKSIVKKPKSFVERNQTNDSFSRHREEQEQDLDRSHRSTKSSVPQVAPNAYDKNRLAKTGVRGANSASSKTVQHKSKTKAASPQISLKSQKVAPSPPAPRLHVRDSQADNLLRDKILNEFITGLCATGILNEEDCANENFFIENEAIMIEMPAMIAICAEMGFLPEDFDPSLPEYRQ